MYSVGKESLYFNLQLLEAWIKRALISGVLFVGAMKGCGAAFFRGFGLVHFSVDSPQGPENEAIKFGK